MTDATFRRPWAVAINEKRIHLISADGHVIELLFGQVNGTEVPQQVKAAVAHQIAICVNEAEPPSTAAYDLDVKTNNLYPCSTPISNSSAPTRSATEPPP